MPSMTMLRPALARGFLNILTKPTRASAAVLAAGASELSGAICPRVNASAPLRWTAPVASFFSLARQPNGFPSARLNLQPQPALQLNFLRQATVAAARPSESSSSGVAKNAAAVAATTRTASTASAPARKPPAAAKTKSAGAPTKRAASTSKKSAAAKGKAASAKTAKSPRRAAGKTSRTQSTKTTTNRASTRLTPAAKRKAAEAKERASQRAKDAKARARAKEREAKAKAKEREAVKKARARAKAKKQREKDAERRKKDAGRARAKAKEATRIKRAPNALNLYIRDQVAGKTFGDKSPPLKELAQRFRELPEADKKKYMDMAAQAKAENTKRREERAKAWAATHALQPYALFYKETFAGIRAANPNLAVRELAKMIGEQWRALPAEGRKKYVDASEADRRAKGLPPAATAAGGAATPVAKP